MKLNEPLTAKQRNQIDELNNRIIAWQESEFEEIANLLELHKPLSLFQKKLAVAKMRTGKSPSTLLKRRRGKGPMIPEIALVVHEALVSRYGFKKAKADELLAQKFGVDPETFRSRIRRLRKEGNLLAEAVLLTAGSAPPFGA